MDTLGISFAVVAIAEIGDKTQLLSILLAARYGRPWAILAGVLAATLINHALSAGAGVWVGAALGGAWFAAALAASFFAMAIWALIPDKADEPAALAGGASAFVAAAIVFFLAEIGDKTQVATIALAAARQDAVAVTIGTTLGMLAANAPAVFLGGAVLKAAPLRLIRGAAAILFALLGCVSLAAWLGWGGDGAVTIPPSN